MEILVNTGIENNLKTKKRKKNFKWHYLYICHHIKTYNNLNKKFNAGEAVPVNVRELRKIISYDYTTEFLKELLDLNILQTDGYFKKGEKSKYYQINPDFDKFGWQLKKIEDKKLKEKIEKLKIFDLSQYYNPVDTLVSNLNEVSLDVEKSTEFVQSTFEFGSRKDSYMYSIKNFDKKYVKRCEKTGRVFNNLTNLPKDLRQFLSFGGEDLYQVDIKCSQPTFLGLHLLKNNLGDKQEVLNFLDDCKTGLFYDKLSAGTDRKTVKKEIFKKCFFNKIYPVKTQLELELESQYPTVFMEIQKLKQVNYKDLPMMLQKVEADLILSVVKDTDCFVLSIHDSLLTTKQCIESVKNNLFNAFKDKYDFEPELTIEKC